MEHVLCFCLLMLAVMNLWCLIWANRANGLAGLFTVAAICLHYVSLIQACVGGQGLPPLMKSLLLLYWTLAVAEYYGFVMWVLQNHLPAQSDS